MGLKGVAGDGFDRLRLWRPPPEEDETLALERFLALEFDEVGVSSIAGAVAEGAVRRWASFLTISLSFELMENARL